VFVTPKIPGPYPSVHGPLAKTGAGTTFSTAHRRIMGSTAGRFDPVDFDQGPIGHLQ